MRYKIIISFVLIISILLTSFVALPVQTVSASAQSDMDRFINNFGLQSYSGSIPALIWYLIYYLGSMGFGIFTVGQLADAMNDPDIKPIINEWIIRTLPGGSEHLLLQQISQSGGGAITVNANQYANDREQISSLFRNGKLEDMRQQHSWNTNPKTMQFGDFQHQVNVVESNNVTSFPFLNYQSTNYLQSLSLPIISEFGEDSEIIKIKGYYYKFKFATIKDGSWWQWYIYVYRSDTEIFSTSPYASLKVNSTSGQPSNISVMGFGVVPLLTYTRTDGSIDAFGSKYSLRLLPYMATNITGTSINDLRYINLVVDESVIMSDYSKFQEPAITNNLIKDITPNIQYIQPTDTVTITPDSRVLQELEQIKAGIRDLDISVPDVVEVPVTTTTTVIREVVNNQTIINNPTIPDVIVDAPALEFDFPEVEKFKVPSLIMSKFPFSIPFDLYNAFAVLRVTKTDPVFTIPVILPSYNISEEIVLDFTKYDLLIELVRWFLLLSFIVTLVILTRRLVKG